MDLVINTNNDNLNRKIILQHATAWIGYALFLFVTNTLTRPNVHFYKILLFIIPIVLTFYTNLFLLRYFRKSNWYKIIAALVLNYIAMSLIGYLFIYKLLPLFSVQLYSSNEIKLFLQNSVLGYVQYFIYASLYFYIVEAVKKEKKLRKLEEEKYLIEQQKIKQELENALLVQNELKSQKEKLQYEYAFLRAQVNPHFLHNTLNVLFAQALDHSSELAENIQKLSKLMRYSIEGLDQDNGKVYVNKELEHLQNLLDIHNLRFAGNTSINFVVEGELNDQVVPPLSIMTIVENAIKYGNLKDPNNPLEIKIVLNPNKVFFYCKNLKRKCNLEVKSTNIGISNLKKRLNVAFENKYKMNVIDEEEYYTFELTIVN